MHSLLSPTGRSADCQWSRHILCLAPRECACPCHVTIRRHPIFDRPDDTLDCEASAPRFVAELAQRLPQVTVSLEGHGENALAIIDRWREDYQPTLESMYDTEDWMVLDDE